MDEYLDAGPSIVALGRYAGTHGVTGRSMEAVFAHVYDVESERVTRFRQFTDTVPLVEAAHKTDASATQASAVPAVPPDETFDGTWPFEARYTKAPGFRMHARRPRKRSSHRNQPRSNIGIGMKPGGRPTAESVIAVKGVRGVGCHHDRALPRT